MLSLVALGACAHSSERPVLYPNRYLQAVGKVQAKRDVNECMDLAEQYEVKRHKDSEVGKKAAGGALIGGAGAGAWGLFRGDAAERAAAGAAAGAATGAAQGVLQSTELSPTFRRFVQRCLQERGYEVIGWD